MYGRAELKLDESVVSSTVDGCIESQSQRIPKVDVPSYTPFVAIEGFRVLREAASTPPVASQAIDEHESVIEPPIDVMDHRDMLKRFEQLPSTLGCDGVACRVRAGWGIAHVLIHNLRLETGGRQVLGEGPV